MLRSDSVDLETAEDVRKLLERGMKKTVPVQPSTRTASNNNNNNTAVYASQVMQTLADTQLWRQLSRQATEWAETAQLWVTNKVENDGGIFHHTQKGTN